MALPIPAGLQDLVPPASRGHGLFYGPNGWIPKRRTFNALVELNGDGTTQDSALLNTLLQTTMSDGDTLEFPRGDYAVGSAQVTAAGKKLFLIFGPGARLVETVANVNPLLFLNGCPKFRIDGLGIQGIETNFVGAGSAQYGAYFHNCPDIVAENMAIAGKSRGLLIDGAQRAKIDGLNVQGLIHYAVQVGAMDISQTSVNVVSTAGFAASGTIKIENEQMTYGSKTATAFADLVRGVNGTAAATHATASVVVEFFTTVNFHTSFVVIDCNHSTFSNVFGRDIGSACLQGNSGPIANAGNNAYITPRGHNCFDNTVYLSSGNDCQVVAPAAEMDPGKRGTIGGSGVKLRGSRHQLIGGKATGTYNGVVISGDSTFSDPYGTSGSGTTISGFVAYQTRGPGFQIPLNTSVSFPNSPMRDVAFATCEAIECCQDADPGVGSVHIVGGIGIDTSGIKVIDHAGDPTTSAAFMEAGTSGQHCQRNTIGGKVIWAPGATACASYRTFYSDDPITDLITFDAPGISVYLDHDVARAWIRRLTATSPATGAATIFLAASSVTDAIVDVPIGASLVDGGTRTQVTWPDRKTVSVTAAHVVTTDEKVIYAGGSGAYNINLPIVSRSAGHEVLIERTSTATPTVLPDASDNAVPGTVLIYDSAVPAGAASKVLGAQWSWIRVRSDKTRWTIIGMGGTIT